MVIKMKDYNTFRNFLESLIISLVPTSLVYLSDQIKTIIPDFKINEKQIETEIVFLGIVFVTTIILAFIINWLFSCIIFRKYKKYEGIWIEIIPNFSRKIAICELYHDRNGYHFDGTNYEENSFNSVEFQSQKFIENGKDSFYYITNSQQGNPKTAKIEGFGKVFELSKRNHGIISGQGFFFDVASASSGSQKDVIQSTILFKFDRHFYAFHKNLEDKDKTVCIKKMSRDDVYSYIKSDTFITKYYNQEPR